MSVLWVATLLFLAGGAMLVAGALRKSAEAAVGLRDEWAQHEELRSALVALRHEADMTKALVARIRSRPDRAAPGR